MKLLWREIQQNMKDSLLFDLLILLQFTVFFWIATQIIGYYIDLNAHPWVQTVKGDYQYYSLALNDAESSFQTMNRAKEDPGYLANAQEALEEVRDREDFTYLAATKEQIYKVSVPDLKKHFNRTSYQDFLAGSLYPGYYEKEMTLPPPEKENLFGTEVISMSFTCMDWNAVKHYHLKASEGRLFEKDDFTIKAETREFPVMLGAAYRPFFEVGDTFSFFYTAEYTARVIGFLEEDSMIITEESQEQDSYPSSLDYDIVFPLTDVEGEIQSEDYQEFMKENYTRALLGILVLGRDASGSESLSAQKEINEIYRAHQLFTVIPVSASDSIYLFQSETRDTVAVITAMVIATGLFNIFSLCLCLVNKIRRNLKRYGIELMNGQKLSRIIYAFMTEIGLMIGGGAVGVIAVRWETFYYNPKYFLAVLFPALLFGGISAAVLIKKLSGVNIETIIRRREG